MKVFYKLRSNLLNDLLPRVEYTNNLLEADVFLTWNSVLKEHERNIELAKEYKIPSFVYNHGLMGEHDHDPNVIDHLTGQNGKPMIADYHLSWGQGGKDILLRAGVPKEKIKIVGCPILWQHQYWYKYKEMVTRPLGFRVDHIVDPVTKEKWELCKEEHKPVKYDGKGQLITFFPNHSMHYIKRTWETYDQIKDFENVFIKAVPEHANWTDSPFKALDSEDRHKKIMFIDPQIPQNLNLVQEVLKKTKIVVTDVPGTIQLQAWAAGCHVVIPRYDWGVEFKKDGSMYTEADCVCEPDKVKETIQDILSGKIDKTKEMARMAELHGALSLGNPTENFLGALNVRNAV